MESDARHPEEEDTALKLVPSDLPQTEQVEELSQVSQQQSRERLVTDDDLLKYHQSQEKKKRRRIEIHQVKQPAALEHVEELTETEDVKSERKVGYTLSRKPTELKELDASPSNEPVKDKEDTFIIQQNRLLNSQQCRENPSMQEDSPIG